MNPGPYGPPQGTADAVPSLPVSRTRFFDLLEQLRVEFEAVAEENRSYHGLRDDYQRKVEKHVAELTLMDQSLAELDRKHQAMKERYEAEIARLQANAAAAAAGNPAGNNPVAVGGPSGPTTAPAGQQALSQAHPTAGPQAHELQQQSPSVNPALAADLPGAAQARLRASLPPSGTLVDQNSGSMHAPHQLQGQKNPGAGSTGIPRDSGPVMHDLPNGANGLTAVGPPVPGPKRLVQLPSAAHGFAQGLNAAGGGAGGPTYPTVSSHTSPPLVGVSSLPSTAHTPALPSVASNGQRLMSAIESSVVKKDNSAMSLGPQLLMTNDMVGVPAGIAPGAQHAGDEDYVVYQGRSPNGSLVNMKVSLQNSLPHDSVVCCVRYSWDGDYLATGSNRSAHIFDVNSGQKAAVFTKDDGTNVDDGNSADSYVRAVCFSRDGNWLITGAEDHVVKVWDVRNRTVKHKLIGHDTDIYSVDASANGAFIVSGSGDKKAKLWSLETGKLLSTFGGEYGPTDGITSVSISPTSQHVAAGSLDKMVRVWDVESSRLVRQFEGHRDSVYSVAFSPDGVLLLSGSLDKTLKLWDLSASRLSDQCRLTFSGHKDFVLSVCFSPDGRWLISGSKDRSVQFWDPRQPTMCVMLQGHKNSVISIAHNPTSMSLATGSGDCRARVWSFGHG